MGINPLQIDNSLLLKKIWFAVDIARENDPIDELCLIFIKSCNAGEIQIL